MSDASPPARRRRSLKSKLSSRAHAFPAVLPDMRFEQSYLSSIRGLIHERDAPQQEASHAQEKQQLVSAGKADAQSSGQVLWLGHIRIDWAKLVQHTVFDQVLSPMLQGAAFGILGLLWARAKLAGTPIRR